MYPSSAAPSRSAIPATGVPVAGPRASAERPSSSLHSEWAREPSGSSTAAASGSAEASTVHDSAPKPIDTRVYSTSQLPCDYGYEDAPVLVVGMKFELPAILNYNGRDMEDEDSCIEMWSPNSAQHAFLPGLESKEEAPAHLESQRRDRMSHLAPDFIANLHCAYYSLDLKMRQLKEDANVTSEDWDARPRLPEEDSSCHGCVPMDLDSLRERPYLPADEQFIGVWINDTSEEYALCLLAVGVPVCVHHRYGPDEIRRSDKLQTPHVRSYLEMTATASLLSAEGNGFQFIAERKRFPATTNGLEERGLGFSRSYDVRYLSSLLLDARREARARGAVLPDSPPRRMPVEEKYASKPLELVVLDGRRLHPTSCGTIRSRIRQMGEKRGHSWKPMSSHVVCYDREKWCELYLRADHEWPQGVVDRGAFGAPAPRNRYYEVVNSEYRLRCPSHWVYDMRISAPGDAVRDIPSAVRKEENSETPIRSPLPPVPVPAHRPSPVDEEMTDAVPAPTAAPSPPATEAVGSAVEPAKDDDEVSLGDDSDAGDERKEPMSERHASPPALSIPSPLVFPAALFLLLSFPAPTAPALTFPLPLTALTVSGSGAFFTPVALPASPRLSLTLAVSVALHVSFAVPVISTALRLALAIPLTPRTLEPFPPGHLELVSQSWTVSITFGWATSPATAQTADTCSLEEHLASLEERLAAALPDPGLPPLANRLSDRPTIPLARRLTSPSRASLTQGLALPGPPLTDRMNHELSGTSRLISRLALPLSSRVQSLEHGVNGRVRVRWRECGHRVGKHNRKPEKEKKGDSDSGKDEDDSDSDDYG
ncbi:hypothetical protein FB451DRAFT_1184495 [Mycena latifolia]|nr:hypothetical protein FB451DRAFT_1184495 [Mycena latifolia]